MSDIDDLLERADDPGYDLIYNEDSTFIRGLAAALRKVIAERDEAREKIRQYTKLLDDKMGTPCEQIALRERAETAERERDELRAKLANITEFAKWCIRESAFSGCDLGGGEVQDKAEALGLIVEEIYSREKHGENIDMDEGDRIYVFSPALAAAIRAEELQ